MKFVTASVSSAGGREGNEDFFGHRVNGRVECWALADGVGGSHGGEAASRLAVDAVMDAFRAEADMPAEAMERLFDSAHRAVVAKQEQDAALAAMRTTLVVLLSDSRYVLWGHAGDSRLYHLRRGRIISQTTDHSVVQKLVTAGELTPDALRTAEGRSRLYRAVGHDGALRPSLMQTPCPLQQGDAFLLCTDGLWEYVFETEMEADFAKALDPGEWLAFMELRMLARAPRGHDNYTAIGIFVVP